MCESDMRRWPEGHGKRGMNHVKSTLIILAAVLALALPSAAMAQNGYGAGGGVLGEQNSGGGGGGSQPSGGNAGEQAAAAPVPAEHGTSGGQLPFTGSDLLVVAGIGMVLLGAGVGLRRLRDNP